MTPKQQLYMIGNAHIDPVWLWLWQDGFHEAKATFRSALDRMKEDPDFVFTASQAAVYEWVEQNDPALFAEIQQRVREGRWAVVGGWWVEPDCNIPSGESFARQGLYGQRYFYQKFGVTCKVGYCVDSFGHNAMLPQILQKSGMPHYVFMRPSPHEKGLPARLFWWEAPDGSRVLTFRIINTYGTWGDDLRQHIRATAGELKDPQNALMCFYGVGDHGGGPTRENIASIHAAQSDASLPELIFASPEQFFAALNPADSFPVIHDDLQHHASGCYAAHSGMKRWNRTAENHLLAAEKLSALAKQVTGLPYSLEFTRAWKNVLFNQFHDVMAGTCLEEAYDDARNQLGEAIAIADRASNQAVQSLTWQINVADVPGSIPIAVFNPHAWSVKANVEVEMQPARGDEVLLDSADSPVAYQIVRSRVTTGWRNRLSFVAELPALGYQLYRFAPGAQATAFPQVQASPTHLENSRYRLEFNPQTGALRSLKDKANDVELLAADAAAVVLDDPSDTWSHDVVNFNHAARTGFTLKKMELIEQGAVKAVMRVTSECGSSTLMQEFSLYNDLDGIEVAVTVDWHEHQKMLKLRFPLALYNLQATYEIPYGSIQRPVNGDEQPAQSWVDVTGGANDQRMGLSLLNDGKYSFDVDGNSLALTVLRSPIYAHHLPAQPQADTLYSYIDQGVQHFHYTLLPHAGGWEQANTPRRAAELNQRAVALVTTCHPGPLTHQASYASVSAENVILSAIKRAEDNDDLIVRAYETCGTTAEAVIDLPAWGRSIQTHFNPSEVKTFRVPRDAALPVRETNLLEGLAEE